MMKNIELIEKIETYINSLGNIGLKEGIRWRSIFTEEDREAKELFRRFIENENLVASEDAIFPRLLIYVSIFSINSMFFIMHLFPFINH